MTLSYILNSKKEDLFRSKGVVAMINRNEKFVFQGVHEHVNFGPSSKVWGEQERRINKFVFIGKGLDRSELEGLMQSCIHPVQDKEQVIASLEEKLRSLVDVEESESEDEQDE